MKTNDDLVLWLNKRKEQCIKEKDATPDNTVKARWGSQSKSL